MVESNCEADKGECGIDNQTVSSSLNCPMNNVFDEDDVCEIGGCHFTDRDVSDDKKYIDPQHVGEELSTDLSVKILWEISSHEGIPTCGLCEVTRENKTEKALFMTVIMDQYPNCQFLIYSLPPSSLRIMEEDQERFRQEIGNSRDYDVPVREFKFYRQATFQYSFRLEELPVADFIGKVAYKQIRNPYPKYYCNLQNLPQES